MFIIPHTTHTLSSIAHTKLWNYLQDLSKNTTPSLKSPIVGNIDVMLVVFHSTPSWHATHHFQCSGFIYRKVATTTQGKLSTLHIVCGLPERFVLPAEFKPIAASLIHFCCLNNRNYRILFCCCCSICFCFIIKLLLPL
jgi:hypothetical protein